jgi:hypothetical protein
VDASKLHKDAGESLLKMNPYLMTSFDLANCVPKRCVLCDYVFLAPLDELVHFEFCVEWRKYLAKNRCKGATVDPPWAAVDRQVSFINTTLNVSLDVNCFVAAVIRNKLSAT